MIVKQIWTANAYRNFNYLIACGETGEALAVDPLDHAKCLRAIWSGSESRSSSRRWIRPATYRNILLGITKASPSTDSFISAAETPQAEATAGGS